MLTAVNAATINHLPDIEVVLEEMRERTHTKAAAADMVVTGPVFGRTKPNFLMISTVTSLSWHWRK
jgi:hypothetical protein